MCGLNFLSVLLERDHLSRLEESVINNSMYSKVPTQALLYCYFQVSTKYLRTEVRGDFNIHGTKNFQFAVFIQKSKIHDVLSLLYLWWSKKPVLYMKN